MTWTRQRIGRCAAGVCSLLLTVPMVAAAQSFVPDDPLLPEQWHLTAIGMDRVWADFGHTYTGSGQVIALIDSGITDHPDLTGKVLPGYDFNSEAESARDGDGWDPDPTDEGDWPVPSTDLCHVAQQGVSTWHGTHVAGIAGAETDNGLGIAAPAADARLLPVRVAGLCGALLTDIAAGIAWAAGVDTPALQAAGVPRNPHPASVINVSLTYVDPFTHCTADVQEAINLATAAGAVVVVAAGNEGTDAMKSTPANCANVIAVGALDGQGTATSYSNYGGQVDIYAPGGQVATTDGILSTFNSGSTVPAEPTYRAIHGTSMAAPLVSSVVALIRQANPALSPSQIEQLLIDTATTTSRIRRLDAYAALKAAPTYQRTAATESTVPTTTPPPSLPRPHQNTSEPTSSDTSVAAIASVVGVLVLLGVIGSVLVNLPQVRAIVA